MSFPMTSAAGFSPDLSRLMARGDVWRGDRLAVLPQASIASGYQTLDAELPGGGWPQGGLTELLMTREGIGELSLLLPALARLSAAGGWLALVSPPWLPHAPAWAAAGIAPERLLLLRPGKSGQQLAWCLEQLLASGGFAAVLGWSTNRGQRLDAGQLRRLQVAAEGRPVFAALWRPAATAREASPAPLRLLVEDLASERAAGDGRRGRRLRLSILKRRGIPASRPLDIDLACPGRMLRAVAGPAFSPTTAASPACHLVA